MSEIEKVQIQVNESVSLVTGNGCPVCDDDGCSVCDSMKPSPRPLGTVNPPMGGK